MTRLVVVACVGVVLYIIAVVAGVAFYIVAGVVAGVVVFGVVFGLVAGQLPDGDGVGSAVAEVFRTFGFRRVPEVFGVVSVFGVLGYLDYLDTLGEVVVGVVVGGVVVAVSFLLFLLVIGIVEVGHRRAALVPEHLRAVPAMAPKTLCWVRGLLPGDEGTAWLAEVTSCLAEAHDKRERRRYVRSYRRAAPQLIWTSWAVHLGASRSRTLS